MQRLATTFGRLTGVSGISQEVSPSPAMPGTDPEKIAAAHAILARMARTETGQDLVVRAREAGLILSAEPDESLNGADSQSHFNRVVQVNAARPKDEQLIAMAGEITRALLARNGIAPTHAHTSLARIQIARIVEAHRLATCAQLADEMARIGDNGPRDVFRARNPAILAAYDRSCASHPDAGTNGAAMAAAFIAFYQDRQRMAADEEREILYLERLQDGILSDIRNFCQPYTGQEVRETKVARAILSVIDNPGEFCRASQAALKQRLTGGPSLLPDGNSDLMKLVNARGVSYVSTFFPGFMPTDSVHGSVTPKTAERIRALDARRSPLYRHFSKASAIPVRLMESVSHPATATLTS